MYGPVTGGMTLKGVFVFVAILGASLAAAEPTNLLHNPTFESDRGWWWDTFSEGHMSYTSSSLDCRTAGCLHAINYLDSDQKGVFQSVSASSHPGFAVSAGDMIVLRAWTRAKSVVPSENESPWTSAIGYSVWIDIHYTDGSTDWAQVKAITASDQWNEVVHFVKPDLAKEVSSLSVQLLFRHNAGEVWFDDVSLEVTHHEASAHHCTLHNLVTAVPAGETSTFTLLVKDAYGQLYEGSDTTVEVDITGASPDATAMVTPAVVGYNSEQHVTVMYPAAGDYQVTVKVNGGHVASSPVEIHADFIPFDFLSGSGDFEAGLGQWQLSSGALAQWIDDAGRCHGGSAGCLELSTAPGEAVWAAIFSVPINQAVPRRIDLEVSYFKSGSHPAQVYADIGYVDGTTGWGDVAFDLGGAAGAWHSLASSFDPLKAVKTLSFVARNMEAESGSHTLIDDVKVLRPVSLVLSGAHSKVARPANTVVRAGVHSWPIEVYDSDGVRDFRGGAALEARIVRRTDGHATPVTIIDEGNGVYAASISAYSMGDFDLEVSLAGEALSNSPLPFAVIFEIGQALQGDWVVTDGCSRDEDSGTIACSSASGLAQLGGTQNLFVNQATPNPLQISGLSMAEGVSSGSHADSFYGLRATATFQDGSSEVYSAAFDAGSSGGAWAERSMLVGGAKAISSLVVEAALNYRAGDASFTDISVVVSHPRASAAHSLCSGDGMTAAVSGRDATLQVHARDIAGQDLNGGVHPEDSLEVVAKYVDYAGHEATVPWGELAAEGSVYKLWYRPQREGVHTVHVLLNGEEVGSSPFEVYVAPQIVEEGETGQLLDNPSFDDAAGGWYAGIGPFAHETLGCRSGDRCVSITINDVSEQASVAQAVSIPAGYAMTPLKISVWCRTEGVPDPPLGWGQFVIYADVEYTDGELDWGAGIGDLHASADWAHQEMVILPRKEISIVRLHYIFRHVVGKVWFDDASVRMGRSAANALTSNLVRTTTSSQIEFGSQQAFRLTVADANGSPVGSSAQQWEDVDVSVTYISACSPGTGSQAVEGVNMVAMPSGTLEFDFAINSGGEYAVSATIGGTHVAGSPVHMSTVPVVWDETSSGSINGVVAGDTNTNAETSSSSTGGQEAWGRLGSVELFAEGWASHAVSAVFAMGISTGVMVYAVSVFMARQSGKARSGAPSP